MRFVRFAGYMSLFATSGWLWGDFARHAVELVSTPAGALAIAAIVILPGLLFLLAPNKWARRGRRIAPFTGGPRLVWSRPVQGGEQGAGGANRRVRTSRG